MFFQLSTFAAVRSEHEFFMTFLQVEALEKDALTAVRIIESTGSRSGRRRRRQIQQRVSVNIAGNSRMLQIVSIRIGGEG